MGFQLRPWCMTPFIILFVWQPFKSPTLIRWELLFVTSSLRNIELLVHYYIMAGRAFVVAKEDFIMETVVFWHCDNGYRTKNNSFGVNSAISIIICSRWLILITWSWDILNRAIFLPNMHWWANIARSWLLRTLAFRIIWIHQSICQRLSLPLYNTHPAWLSLTNELKFVD